MSSQKHSSGEGVEVKKKTGRERRIAKGLCGDCTAPASVGSHYCLPHILKRRAALKRYSDRHPGRNSKYLPKGRTLLSYGSWVAMKARCTNPNAANFHKYGGRGITICERWRDFNIFLADMGERPSKNHSLDRINNNGNYEPSNCRWATIEQQLNNTRTNRFLTHEGETLSLSQWARRIGLTPAALDYRLKTNWTIERLLALTDCERRRKQ